MAFADDLLKLAQDIANLPAADRRQANLRRAVSTAYYALFHLLISEATLNCGRPELRPALGRLFDHGPMNTASTNKEADLNAYFNNHPSESPERVVAGHLRSVAKTFVRAQQRRIDADYNLGKEVEETDMLTQLETVTTHSRVGTLSAMKRARRLIFSQCLAARNAGRRGPVLPSKRNPAGINTDRRLPSQSCNRGPWERNTRNTSGIRVPRMVNGIRT
ncbi:MAG TPA: hypothetical protein VIX89_12695 [Bryobacteraceae bacterium]